MERPPIKKLYYRKRSFGCNALMKTEMRSIEKTLFDNLQLMEVLTMSENQDDKDDLAMLEDLELVLIARYEELRLLPQDYFQPLPRIIRQTVSINGFTDNQCMELFRFRDRSQLRRLLLGFKFPEFFILQNGIRFTGEEILLAGLYRLTCVNRFGDDGWQNIFGWVQSRRSCAFSVFIKFMITNWLRLVENHFTFWSTYLAQFADTIKIKLEALANSMNLNIDLTSAYLPGGFNVFGFIDNTCVETCRPGGGPTEDGTNAPRNDPLIQRAFYNGWKKHHGLKFQTVDLPNGMNYNVWGGCSLRHNDIWTFYESKIHDHIVSSQLNSILKYKIYGDSAYVVITEDLLAYKYSNPTQDQVNMNQLMSSCRECIEWNYGEIFRYFKLLDYNHCLKIRQMDVESIFKIASILRNAHVTMNGNNTSLYFNCAPPLFEDWIR